jgi:hypothetical protein
MSRPIAVRTVFVAALIASAATLGACGRAGPLARPEPMFGRAKTNVPPAGEENRRGENPADPVADVDMRDSQDNSPVPPRVDPIRGQGPDPTAVAPQGVLPNPYARPQ